MIKWFIICFEVYPMHELLHGFLIIIIYFAVCATSALLLHLFTPIPDEPFRKLLHFILLGSLAVWLLVFDRWWISALSAVAFALLVYPLLSLGEHLKGYSAMLTERKTGEIKHSLLLVFFMYAIVCSICWGWLGDRLLTLACIYAWGIGDALAALIGKRFGKHKIYWRGINGKKSYEGSAAMFAASFVSVLVILLCHGGMAWYGYAITSLAAAAVSALTELYTPGGRDTFTCPIAAMAVILPLEALFGGLPL